MTYEVGSLHLSDLPLSQLNRKEALGEQGKGRLRAQPLGEPLHVTVTDELVLWKAPAIYIEFIYHQLHLKEENIWKGRLNGFMSHVI